MKANALANVRASVQPERKGVMANRKETLVGYRKRDNRSGGISAHCQGYEVRDRDGDKIGKVDETFVNQSDQAEYIGVKTGLLGGKLSMIPAELATADDERRIIEVSETKNRVKDAPSLDSNEEITTEREREIRDYFGLGSGSSASESSGKSGNDASREISPGYREDVAREGPTNRDAPTSEADSRGYSAVEDEHSQSQSQGRREPWSGATEGSASESERSGRREESSMASQGGASRETVRVTVWREKARAESVPGDDGSEEVRIRKEWVEEEEIVEVEESERGERPR